MNRNQKIKSTGTTNIPTSPQMRQRWRSLGLLKSNVKKKNKIMQPNEMLALGPESKQLLGILLSSLTFWKTVFTVADVYLQLWYRHIFRRRSCSNTEHYPSEPPLQSIGQMYQFLPLSSLSTSFMSPVHKLELSSDLKGWCLSLPGW